MVMRLVVANEHENENQIFKLLIPAHAAASGALPKTFLTIVLVYNFIFDYF